VLRRERRAAGGDPRAQAHDLERRLQERTRELELQTARLEAVLQVMPAGIVVADARTGLVVQANRHAEELLGGDVTALRRDDLRGYRLDGTPLGAEEWPLARALLRGEVVREERLRVEDVNGSARVLEVNAAPIRDESGGVESAVAVFWDTTEREWRERIERDFVTNAAHELQTPLAAIISAAEVLDAGAKEEPEHRDRFLAHIRRECDRLARLVHALLTLARAQTRAEPPPVEVLELQSLLDEVALSVRPAAGVELRVDCPARLTVRTNRFLLEQAVASLGENAAKHTARGRIWFRARRRPGGVEIEVADEGSGLPPGQDVRLFERFYRGGDRDASGFGLGLAIVREAVAALGGRVELARRRPRGTSARIVVPDTGEGT
jgi:PAS domain S-box-containing protein